jgi:hypothetical protein
MNRATASRLLLAASALLLLVGAGIHAMPFHTIALMFDSASLSVFLVGASKALWLADSSNLAVLGLVFTLLAARPQLGSPSLIALLAVAPLASAGLIYAFLGAFYALYLLLVAAALALWSAGLRHSVQMRIDEGART